MFSSSVAAAIAAAPCTVWAGPVFGWWWLFIPLFWIAVFVLIFTFAGRRWRRVAAARGGLWPPSMSTMWGAVKAHKTMRW